MVALHPYGDSLAHGPAIPLVRRDGPAIPIPAWLRSTHEALVRVEETFRVVADHYPHYARSARPMAYAVMLLDSDQPIPLLFADRPV